MRLTVWFIALKLCWYIPALLYLPFFTMYFGGRLVVFWRWDCCGKNVITHCFKQMQSVVWYSVDIFKLNFQWGIITACRSVLWCLLCVSQWLGSSVLLALYDLAVWFDAVWMVLTGGQYQHEKGRLPGLYFLGQDYLISGAGSAVAWPREIGGQTWWEAEHFWGRRDFARSLRQAKQEVGEIPEYK